MANATKTEDRYTLEYAIDDENGGYVINLLDGRTGEIVDQFHTSSSLAATQRCNVKNGKDVNAECRITGTLPPKN